MGKGMKESKKTRKEPMVSCIALGVLFLALSAIAKRKRAGQEKDGDLKRDRYVGAGEPAVIRRPTLYEKRVKRMLDKVLSFVGLVALAPVYILLSLAIYVDDPGSVLFRQKRVGKNKEFFRLHKFRTMRVSTPHNVPTHQLGHPEKYITRVGRVLRKYSLDELPQLWDIFMGNMSIVGPRPALWNQADLVKERDRYGINDIRPGLTGWAQINGRDELEIPVKVKFDAEYMQRQGFWFDARCFLGTFVSVLRHDGVVEGNAGKVPRGGRHYTDGRSGEELIGHIGFGQQVEVDRAAHKKVLIAGAGSYIGESFQTYAGENYPDNFEIDTVDMVGDAWKDMDFSQYDIVYHVAGIAHADVGNVSEDTREKYYAVNTDLAIAVAGKAKAEGVGKFILMSSMIVYGESAPCGKEKVIGCSTVPRPASFYGDSKLQADVGVRGLADACFKVVVLRPPMVYGRGSKGNYPTLAKLAKRLPVFPDIKNKRSMLYIGNLCEFLCQVMLVGEYKEDAIVLMPQNGEWVKTVAMVEAIRSSAGGDMHRLAILGPAVSLASKMLGKVGKLVNKAFGNYCYGQEMSEYAGLDYRVVNLEQSIARSEGDGRIHGTQYATRKRGGMA